MDPPLGDLLSVHAIPFDDANARALAAVSIDCPAFYLLRPDGHIGLAGTRFDAAAVMRWLRDTHMHCGAGRDEVQTQAAPVFAASVSAST